jgi:hypothetical protein
MRAELRTSQCHDTKKCEEIFSLEADSYSEEGTMPKALGK